MGGERKMRTLSLGLFVENGLASLHTLIEPRRVDHTEMCDGPESSTRTLQLNKTHANRQEERKR